MMRSILKPLLAILLLAFCTKSLCADDLKTDVECGKKTPLTITVKITGAVSRSGIYYITKSANLSDLLGKVGLPRIETGMFDVLRYTDGKKNILQIKDEPDFELLDGDVIYAETMSINATQEWLKGAK